MGRIDAGGVGRFAPRGDVPALWQADAVIDDISAGRQVSPDVAEGIRNTLVNLLWSDAPAEADRARSRLLALDRFTTNQEDRAEMLGYAIAVGETQGRLLFDALVNQGAGEALSPGELKELRASLDEPTSERLSLLVKLLDRQSPEAPKNPGYPSDRSPVGRRTRDPSEDDLQDRPNDDGNAGRDRDLKDPSLDLGLRLQIVLDLGQDAVQPLSELIQGDQKEFAAVALIHLGRSPEHGQAVFRLAQRLEFDPGTRPLGEMIRRGLEQPSGSTTSNFNMAKVGDGLLQQALDACDQPNLLLAAAGREAVVIRRVMRRIVEVRAGQ